MFRNEHASRSIDVSDIRSRVSLSHSPEHSEPRTIVIRQGSAWQSLAFLCLCLLLIAAVLMGHLTLRGLDAQNQQLASSLVRVDRKIQQLEAGIGFDSKRRQLLLGMRNHIVKVNPRVSLGDAYRYAALAVDACEKYPAVDPLLLLAIGVVESGYDPLAKSPADARGLYQIWPSTGRLLVRALGWNYDDSTLYDAEKNTQAAALYLDMLFATYSDPQMVLAEYNGGPLNAGYFRAGVGQLAPETRDYVPKVLALHARLREQFEKGMEPQLESMPREAGREGKTLDPGRSLARSAEPAPGRGRPRPPDGPSAR
jgi:Transglycosylase SLT domain